MKDNLTLLCSPESKKQISHVKGLLPEPGGRETALSPEIENLGLRRRYKQTLLLFHYLLSQGQTLSCMGAHKNKRLKEVTKTGTFHTRQSLALGE